jgi:dienelactone hydrolase
MRSPRVLRHARSALWLSIIAGLGLGLLLGRQTARWHRAADLLTALASAPRQDACTARRDGPRQRDLFLTSPEGSIRARLYLPKGRRRQAVVLGHGVHYRGIDEPRLVAFARHLAGVGFVVLTPELKDLTDYRVTSEARRVMSRGAEWLGSRGPETETGRLGLMGFSFAGGIALLVATDPRFRDRIDHVTSVGGYHDLERTLRYLLTGQESTPEGVRLRPSHDYGLVVLAYQFIDTLVPPDESEAARAVLRAWLQENRSRAAALVSERRSAATERLYQCLFSEDLEQYSGRIARRLDRERAVLRSLSPSRQLSRVAARVYLLHGADDNVIPPSETEWAAAELREARGLAWQTPPPLGSGRALITTLFQHVTVERAPNLDEQLALLDFIAQLM